MPMKLKDGIHVLREAGWTERSSHDGHVFYVSPDGSERVKMALGSRCGPTSDCPGWIVQAVRKVQKKQKEANRR